MISLLDKINNILLYSILLLYFIIMLYTSYLRMLIAPFKILNLKIKKIILSIFYLFYFKGKR